MRRSGSVTRTTTKIAQVLFVVGGIGIIGAGFWKAARHFRARGEHARRVVLPAEPIEARPVRSEHPRLLLDDAALARLRAAAKAGTPAWTRVQEVCAAAMAPTPIASGYQAFEWSAAVADLALCWHATGEPRYAAGALRYVRALLDDRYLVGDGAGGDDVVTHDTGYPIRTYAVYAALAYDWLHDAPGMDDALRQRIAARLSAWLGWYRAHGYLNDQPISNYFMGYLTAAVFAGLAVDGADGAAWWTFARDELLAKLMLPALRHHLAGGDWSEGWQYGELSAAELALCVAAVRTATGTDLVPQIPWLVETVSYHQHSLLPGRKSVYDSGTWGVHPAAPSRMALTALPLALQDSPGATPATERLWAALRARQLADSLAMGAEESAWMGLLAERVGGLPTDLLDGTPLGYHTAGTGVTLLRSAWWTDDAVFVSLQLGPRRAVDHQHLDQGHFELWRGADGLLVDGGDEEGDATINHNTLLIDDGKRVMNYAPNQGVWGWDVAPSTYFDDGAVAVASGDFADAYAPSCKEDGCKARSVERAERTLVYVRPSLVVISDRVRVTNDSYTVTWAAHVGVAPVVDGAHASAVVGGSRVDVWTVAPPNATPIVRREPTPTKGGIYDTNAPREPMWRLEVATPTGTRDRRLLHWITASVASAANAAASVPPVALSGPGHTGGVSNGVAVLFADDPKGGHFEVPAGTTKTVIVGLAPGAQVDLTGGGEVIVVGANP